MNRLRRAFQVQRAFLRIGWLHLISYPAAFVTTQAGVLVEAVLYVFVAKLISASAEVGGDYYTYVIIGLAVMSMLHAALNGFGSQMDFEIQQGRLEGLLIEPVDWRVLPFGMASVMAVTRVLSVTITILVAIPLGADFRAAGFPAAILLVALGYTATLAIGIMGTSVKILAKRSDPILLAYSLAALLFSGVLFPIERLPGWLQPASYLIPHTYVISGARQLLMADGAELGGPSISTSLVALAIITVVLHPLAMILYSRIMEVGRRLGVLAGY